MDYNPEFEALRSTADEVDAPREIVRKYTEEELTEFREEATNTLMALYEEQERAKAVKEEKQKPLQGRLKILMAKLKAGFVKENVIAQGVINEETGKMEYFDENAALVDERPLRKDEREQLKFPKQGRGKGTRREVNNGFDESPGGSARD